MNKRLHLICNAHLDPVWLWEWEEGAAEALSTFRCAADFCDEFDGFVFNHNEAVLYRWVQEYEPALFKRIHRLIQQGKWHVMGGWWLQPDCNLPSGESLVRQILLGKTWFKNNLGVEPRSAMNVDPFGHSRGLVQILAKSGHDSYLFCRPLVSDQVLPGQDFRWLGYDGSEVLGHRVLEWYNSGLGKAGEKISSWLQRRRTELPNEDLGMILWGVGNHGGGPSRQDLRELAKIQKESRDWQVLHSTPEAYFKEVAPRREQLPIHAKDLNPWGVGCYTSQIRIKQLHRQLENELYATEQMAAAAFFQQRMAWPETELSRAQEDLLFSEFHDILPGSSIQRVEDTSIRLLNHGLEEISRIKGRAFFALAQGQAKAKAGEIPVLVYNPHPFSVTVEISVEFQLQDQNWKDEFTNIVAYHKGRALPTQVEKEASNLTLDWRKKVVFRATLAPSAMNRFDCKLHIILAKPVPEAARLTVKTADLDAAIDPHSGLLSRWKVQGHDFATAAIGTPLVIKDNEDPWGMSVHAFRTVSGSFTLLTPTAAARFAGVRAAELAPVRVIEDGPVRKVIEALFGYGLSRLQLRWLLPKNGSAIGLEVRVLWNEKDSMLKLSVPTGLAKSRLRGQVAYGVDDLPSDGNEVVAQQWVAVTNERFAVTVVNNGTYGSDCLNGELRLSLLRSPAYSAHPINDRPLVPQDRLTPRIDQGERQFSFRLMAGPATTCLAAIDRQAVVFNRPPMALSFFPAGGGSAAQPGFLLSDDLCQLTACKRAENGKGLILRIFNPSAEPRRTTLRVPVVGASLALRLSPFEIRTLRLRGTTFTEVDLLEKPLKKNRGRAP